MATNKPEVVAYHHVNKENPTLRGVSLFQDPSCHNESMQVEPLIRLSDYEALAAHVERLINAVRCNYPDVENLSDAEAKEVLGNLCRMILKEDEPSDLNYETPATALARLKAQWQAEVLDKLADAGCWSSEAIRREADELRRQAEGES